MLDIFGKLVQNIYYNFFFIPPHSSKLQKFFFALSYTDKPIYDTLLLSANNVNKIIIIFQNSQFLFLYFFYNPPWISRLQEQHNANKRRKKKLFRWDFFYSCTNIKKKLKRVIKPFYTLSAINKVQKKWRCIISTSSPSWNTELLQMGIYCSISCMERRASRVLINAIVNRTELVSTSQS